MLNIPKKQYFFIEQFYSFNIFFTKS